MNGDGYRSPPGSTGVAYGGPQQPMFARQQQQQPMFTYQPEQEQPWRPSAGGFASPPSTMAPTMAPSSSNNNLNASVPQRDGAAGGTRLFEDLSSNEFFSSVADSHMTRIGIDVGRRWMGTAKDEFEGTLSRWLSSTNLKYYFNVNNSYVLNKIRLLLCPVLHKSWKRRVVRTQEGQEVYPPPKDDLNAPDLYLPLMAFVTYILIAGFILGTRGSFTPEVLGMAFSKGFISLCIEVVLLKFGFYLLNSIDASVFDFFSFGGYIFVGLCVNHLAGLLGGPYVYYATMLLTGFFMATFMVKTLRLLVLPDQPADMDGGVGLPSNRRNYFLLSIALLQIIFSYFLGVY
ncbi:Protein transport protein yif1 [Balamuthia mandrillaris]